MSAGRRSIMAFQMERASSYPASSDRISSPRRLSLNFRVFLQSDFPVRAGFDLQARHTYLLNEQNSKSEYRNPKERGSRVGVEEKSLIP